MTARIPPRTRTHDAVAYGCSGAAAWERRSEERGRPNHIMGWAGGDKGSTLNPPEYMKLAGPWIDGKDPAGDARIDISVSRSHFNELAAEGRLKHWVDAYEHGHLRVSGDAAVTKLIGNVIQRQLARA